MKIVRYRKRAKQGLEITGLLRTHLHSNGYVVLLPRMGQDAPVSPHHSSAVSHGQKRIRERIYEVSQEL